MLNFDKHTVEGFGEEWARFDQDRTKFTEVERRFDEYFAVFPWELLTPSAVGFDAGCGTGRWAAIMARRVGTLHCVDASLQAVNVARRTLEPAKNAVVHHASIQAMPFADNSMDFGYSLGVLHHVPDTQAALNACVSKLRSGAPFLCYLYYSFDNRPEWYRHLWRVSDVSRQLISRAPFAIKHLLADVLAATVYFPIARGVRFAARAGKDISNLPLAYYRDASFYAMRTDALDRFGTRLEQRFNRDEIRAMMTKAGLTNIRFSNTPPYWCAVGFRKA